jgi:hypothetical protein
MPEPTTGMLVIPLEPPNRESGKAMMERLRGHATSDLWLPADAGWEEFDEVRDKRQPMMGRERTAHRGTGRLLREPRGFEGFRSAVVERRPDHLAVAKLPEEHCVGNAVQFQAAASAFRAQVMPHDDLAGRSDQELDRRKFESLEGFFSGGSELSDFLVAAVDTPLRADRPREVKDPVRIRHLRQGIKVARAHGRVRRPHDLDVLLRHRPPSISFDLRYANGEPGAEPPRREGGRISAAVGD